MRPRPKNLRRYAELRGQVLKIVNESKRALSYNEINNLLPRRIGFAYVRSLCLDLRDEGAIGVRFWGCVPMYCAKLKLKGRS